MTRPSRTRAARERGLDELIGYLSHRRDEATVGGLARRGILVEDDDGRARPRGHLLERAPARPDQPAAQLLRHDHVVAHRAAAALRERHVEPLGVGVVPCVVGPKRRPVVEALLELEARQLVHAGRHERRGRRRRLGEPAAGAVARRRRRA